ncbi:MAG: hypothetical protein GOU97_03875 [Nanoarchaeota archaeon]|nr:hypothetical protein [Nanoarchaeota archaeon]
MTFKFIITSSLRKQLDKLFRKDRILALTVRKKIIQIMSLDGVAIQHFKNLAGSLKDYKRVHVGGFVLTFKIEKDTVIFDKLRHHDKAYRR